MGDAVEVGVRMWTPKDIMDWPPPECERVPVYVERFMMSRGRAGPGGEQLGVVWEMQLR